MVDKDNHELLEHIDVDQDSEILNEQQELTPPEEAVAENSVDIDTDCDVSISGPRFQRDSQRPTPRLQRLLRALGSASNVLFDVKRFPDA